MQNLTNKNDIPQNGIVILDFHERWEKIVRRVGKESCQDFTTNFNSIV